MINTSDKYKSAVAKSGRHFLLKVVINGVEYTGIKNFKIKGGTNSSNEITIGDTVSAFIDFVLTDVPDGVLLKGRKVTLYIGLQLSDGSVEWIKRGVFNLEKPIRSDGYIKISAYDNFALCSKGFFSNLKGSQKIKTILEEQCKKIGNSFAGGADDVNYNVDSLQGLTIREAIGILAAYCGKNAIMDNNGSLKFIWYTDIDLLLSPSHYADPLEVAEEDTVINRLDCTISEDKSLSAGTGIGIYFSCPGMTQTRLNTLFNKLKGFRYRAAKVTWKMAHPDVESGDLIKVMDRDGSIYIIPLMEYEFSCDGGYYGTVESKGKSEEEQENSYKGPMQTKIERTYSDLVSTKQVLADKITAYDGEFERIETNYLQVNTKLIALEGEIGELDVSELTAKVAHIEESYVNKQYANEIYATKVQFGTLDSEVANLGTIINRVTTSDSIHSLLINANTAVIDDGYFKSIVSKLITVNDLLAGDISTTRFKVKSDSGNLLISDNTIQIKDTARVRVQIGKDATNDYSLSLWDAAGTLIWDARGLKAAGIKDAIIRNDMVAANANIDGKKINIASVVTEINNGTTTINANHILYDGKSLDVAFGTMQTSVSTVTKTVTDNKSKWDTASTNASDAVTTANQAKSTAESANTNASNALNKASSVETRANNGEFDGRGVGTTSIAYQTSANGTVAPTGTWTNTVPSVPAGQYLWTRTTITYTDETTDYIYTVAKMGANGTNGSKGDKGDTGATGNGISSITNYYLASASASGVTVSTSGWTTTPQSVSTSKKYHWSYQIINYTNGSKATTTPAIIGVYGDTGAKGATGASGKGINAVAPQYYLSTSSTAQSGGSWKTTQDAWSTGKYYWTRDAITWSDGSTTYTTPALATGLNNANVNAQNAITQVTTVTETVKTHSTQITAQEGKIATLITDTTQVKKDITAVRGEVTTAKGNITTLQSNYSSINQTISGLNSTVGQHTSSIANVQTLADSKAKVFVTTPTTPYKIGDLWVQGSSGVIMRCKVARASGTYTAADWEKGDKYTDDTTANKVKTELSTTIKAVTDKQATFQTSLDSVTSRVSKTETSLTEVNGKVTGLTTRISSAENKITSDAIVNTVRASTSYKGDLNAKVNSKEIISTINQTAETVRIDASKIELIGKVTISALDASTQSLIKGAAQKIYHSTNGTSGASGFFLLASLVIEDTYQNQPIKISVVNRGRLPSTVWINFANVNTKDPALATIKKSGNSTFYIAKRATSTWDLYVGKSEAYDNLSVTEFSKGNFMKGTTVTWKTTQVSTLPSGYVEASQLAASAEWCYNNDITYINGGKIYAGTVTAEKIKVSSLSALSANLGTVTAGKITGVTITGGSITSNTTIKVTTDAYVGKRLFINCPSGVSTEGVPWGIVFTPSCYISSASNTIGIQSSGGAFYLGASYFIGSGGYTNIGGSNGISFDSKLFTFNNSVYVGGSGVKLNNTGTSRAIYATYADGNNHDVLSIGANNLDIYCGGSSINKEQTTNIRGKYVKLYNHSGGYCRVNGSAITSDENLKYDFKKPLNDQRYVDFFMNLEPITYKYKTGTAKRPHIGFTAQGVERALYKAGLSTDDFAGIIVHKNIMLSEDDEDMNYLINQGINEMHLLRMEEFIGLNTAFIQRHEAKLSSHDLEIQKLKSEIAELKSKLNSYITGDLSHEMINIIA